MHRLFQDSTEIILRCTDVVNAESMGTIQFEEAETM